MAITTIDSSGLSANAVGAGQVGAGVIGASQIIGGATVRQVITINQTANFTTNSYTYVDFLTVNITLTSASSTVLVCGVVLGGESDHGAARVTRNGTQIPVGSGVPGRGNANKSIIPSTYSSAFGNNAILGGGFLIVDQPGQTGNVYKIQVSAGPISGPQTFNVGFNTSGSAAYYDAINYLQIIELA